jgi:hypothetical protein
MEPPPANHRAAESHESLMDVGAFVEACAQSTELVQQRQGLFHDVAEDTQSAAMFLVSPSDSRGDVPTRQFHPVRIRVVSTIAHHFLGLAQRRAEGATKVQEFHRQLFLNASDTLRKKIKRITGVEVYEASAEVDPKCGPVIQVFPSGTMVQVFLLSANVPSGSFNGGNKI